MLQTDINLRKTYLLRNFISLPMEVLMLPKYKYGKVTAPIDYKSFEEAMEKASFPKGRALLYKSFIAFLYWFGVRKAEALERRTEDFIVEDNLLIVNAIPKKGGHREPLEIPANYPYVDLIIKKIDQTRDSTKNDCRRIWSFSPRTAINIVKRVMGDRYYPHFFRLNRATRFLEDPTTTLPEMKAWFGWKAAKTVDPYIGYSRRHIRRQRQRLKKELE
jgi:integrase